MGHSGDLLSSLVAVYRSGQREEKHGIYCVGHTLPTLVKSHVLCSFGIRFGAHLGALGHILVVQGGAGNRSEFRWKPQLEF